jgi:Domain of unknown function (DUF4389)
VSTVPEHAVRLSVSDDLRRSRLTVFFRILLAIPHFIWLFLWGIGALVAAILLWFAALVRGTAPEGLHDFLAAYVRYTVHVLAYVTLAANPYPGFSGDEDYPVDVTLPGPTPQKRWKIALRLVLAVPVIVLTAALLPVAGGGGAGTGNESSGAEGAYQYGGALAAVAFFAWFASLVLGRTPHGLRNFAVYGLRYAAEVWAYVFVLTERYPNSNPVLPAEAGSPPERPIQIRVEDDLRRSRLTVFFRLLLTLPHIVWLALWTIAALLVGFVAWLIALLIGRVPSGLHGFLAAWLRYGTHVGAFLLLAANPFPGFTGAPGSYPVDLEIGPPAPQRRLVTFFRFFLAFPALVLESSLGALAALVAFFGWFASLATGRMPLGFANVLGWYFRYAGQTTG